MNEYTEEEVITVVPMKTFPVLKDLVTDVSWNYEQNKKIKPVKLNEEGRTEKGYVMYQEDVDRVQEFRKCIECYLCQNTCHVLRDHDQKDRFVGPRFMIRAASLEMHPLDTEDRIPDLRNEHGSGMCNITKCCTVVCPEHIAITDNGIIPMKERVVDRYYDPISILRTKIFGRKKKLPPKKK
jgi:succinate dehydrogenase / fumarate reductase iron-sulfur subunit